MSEQKFKKVVLAYSGGLDTSIIIPWLKENYGCEVIAVAGNVGQDKELSGLKERAIKTGASKIYIEDLTDEFVDEYIIPTMQAGAVYENTYLLGTSFARPPIAKRIVEIAKKEGADAICHGCTGKGNDQVRFELTIKAFAPEMPIIAPWRIWDLKSRDEEIDYAIEKNVPITLTRETNYSKDMNLWHLSHEGLDLEDPSNEPDYDKILELSVTPEKAPDKPTYVSIDFEKGVPVAIDGEKMKASEIIRKLNKLGGENGIGIIDIVENRLVGMKSRGVYETPGGTILMAAHEQLEELILDRDTLAYKKGIGDKFADVVYEGKWFTPLREALQAFVESTQQYVTGEVKLKLYKGNIIKQGTTSPYSLYNESIASFTTGDLYDHHDAEGFINLFGLSLKVRAMMMQNNKDNK
jgi:argininosuccinate synthase